MLLDISKDTCGMNDGIILTLAYPETIVMVADEWYSKFLYRFGIGKKNYVRAGHAALVLIDPTTGILEYHDFGRYITPEPFGRVRGKDTDRELDFPIMATFEKGKPSNLPEILKFLATHPKLTHGQGTLYASVCDEINYEETRKYITKMQQKHFIYYAAFKRDATNCARFVTDTLIAGVTNKSIKKKLKQSKWFTPSTIGNVIHTQAGTEVYKVSGHGTLEVFESLNRWEITRLFLDKLTQHQPNFVGTVLPKHNAIKSDNAQWLSGIGAGAWFELYDLKNEVEVRFRRISPEGHIDVDGIYKTDTKGFNITMPYEFLEISNCKVFHIKQDGMNYRFEMKI